MNLTSTADAIQTLPDAETLEKCFNVNVLDVKGERIALGKLVDTEAAQGRKTVVVLTRHFFCGSCQLRTQTSMVATLRL